MEPDRPSPPEPSKLEKLWAGEAARTVIETVMTFVPGVALVVSAPDAKVLYVSEYASRLVGRPRRDLENVSYERHATTFPAFAPDGRLLRIEERPEIRALAGEVVEDVEGSIFSAEGEQIALVCNSAPIRDARGEVIGAVARYTDIRRHKAVESELREQVEHSRALHEELAHRVKNHLQTLSGLIDLESRGAPTGTAGFARKVMGMMQGLATVYESITRAGGEESACVDARAFLDDICSPYRTDAIGIEVRTTPADLTLASARASALAILVNEAVCNSFKHAFPAGRGRIEVRLDREAPDRLRLEIADDGVGRSRASPERISYGAKVIEMQARWLDGRLSITDRAGGGTVVVLDLPEEGEVA